MATRSRPMAANRRTTRPASRVREPQHSDVVRELPELRGEVPLAGTVLFPHSTVNVAKLANRLLKQYGTVIAEGRFFGVPDHFRLGLGGDPRDLRKGLANLRRLLRSMS